MDAIGHTSWVISAARVPAEQHQEVGRVPRRASHRGHDRGCLLNTGDIDAAVRIMLFFDDRSPAGPYGLTVPAQSMRYCDFAHLQGTTPVPVGTDFCAVFTSDVPIVVQHVQLQVHDDTVTTVSGIAYAS